MSTSVLFPECCRCCLVEEEDMVYVFDILDEFNSKICDLIQSSGGIQISLKDCFSKNICGNCLNDLASAARFRNRCSKTQHILLNTSVVVDETINTEHSKKESEDFETIILEEAREKLSNISHIKVDDDGDILEYSDDQRDFENESPCIQYIIAENSSDPELNVLDYDSLISSRNSVYHEDDAKSTHSRLEMCDTDDELTTKSRETILNFVCPNCGAGFAFQKNLAKHMALHQSFVCDICLLSFESNEELSNHQSLGHPDASDDSRNEGKKRAMEPKITSLCKPRKKHSCEYCDKSFVSNSALTTHIRVHTDERPYSCSFCAKRFRTVGAQELHERRHSGIKPYTCDICGRGFAESSNLKVHRRTHTNEKPHICTICNRAFARVFLLKVHQRTHTGERPFSCEDCGKPFAQQGDLAAHRRTHTGERPHKCDLCGSGFIKKSGLIQHRKKHGKELPIEIQMVDLKTCEDESTIEYEDYPDDVQPDDLESSDNALFETIIVRHQLN